LATELNHDTIKAAIVTILKADTTNIYDESDGTDKLRSITVGWPLGGDPFEDKNRNFAFVVSNTILESNRVMGAIVSDAIKVIEHTCRYDIHFVMHGEQGRDCEKNLDTMQKAMMEVFEEGQDLGATVDQSYPERVIVLRPEETHGKTKQGRIITIKAIITTGD